MADSQVRKCRNSFGVATHELSQRNWGVADLAPTLLVEDSFDRA